MKDKVAVITGAGQGMGRAMARLFAAHGSHERARRILGEVCREAEERGDGLIAADARELLAKLATRS